MWETYRMQFANPCSLADCDQAAAAVAGFIEAQDQRAIELRSVKGACGVAHRVIKTKKRLAMCAVEGAEDVKLVQFSCQIAEGFRLVIAAGNRRFQRFASAKDCPSAPRRNRTAGDGDTTQVFPFDLRLTQAKIDGLSRESLGPTCPQEFAFLDSGDDSISPTRAAATSYCNEEIPRMYITRRYRSECTPNPG